MGEHLKNVTWRIFLPTKKNRIAVIKIKILNINIRNIQKDDTKYY